MLSRLSCVALLLLVAGCSTARSSYYNAWEKFGYAKRERLVDDVKDARNSQENAKKQFTTALAEFKSITNYQGGNLEKAYDKLSGQYEKSDTQAKKVKEKVQTVKNVSAALFTEWRGEIGEIKDDPSLQRQSQTLYDKTKSSYETLIERMDRAAASMDPVVQKFKNRVLFLKSNLNAQAIASLAGTEAELSTDIDRLVREMESAIAEADAFIASQNLGK